MKSQNQEEKSFNLALQWALQEHLKLTNENLACIDFFVHLFERYTWHTIKC